MRTTHSASGTVTDVIAQPLTVTSIAAVSPNPRNTAVSSINVTFSVPINTSSPTAARRDADRQRRHPSRSAASHSRLVPGTTSTYQVGELSAFTFAGGSYTLTVNAADIDDQNGTAGTGSLSTSWLVSRSTPTISWANPAGHRLRHGPERSPARRHGQRAGDVHLHAGHGHCPWRRQQPDALGLLHAHRHDRLHHGLVDRDRERRPGHANGGQRQPGQHHVRHGPGQRPAQRERDLDRERQHRHGARHLHLRQRGRNRARRRQWPERGGHLHPHRHDRLHHGLVDRDRERRPGHANGGQRQPGQHHVRHGPGQRRSSAEARAGP